MAREVEETEETCFYGQDLFVSQMVKTASILKSLCVHLSLDAKALKAI